MPETLSGTTPEWGIESAQTGIILESQDEDWQSQIDYSINLVGEKQGFSLFDSTCNISIAGEVPTTTPFSSRMAATLVLQNDPVEAGNGAAAVGSKIFITGVKRTVTRGAWRKINVSAIGLPNHT